MFEGGRKACKMSLKKVQEKNKVIFAKQKMLLKEWEEAMTRRTTTTTTTTAVKRSTKAKKEKKKTKSQENLSEESKDRNTITTSDTQTMNNRKTMILKPCAMDSFAAASATLSLAKAMPVSRNMLRGNWSASTI